MEHHMGHLEKMLSPLKHERRLAVCDAARSEVHQLVVVKHASIFVNTGKEATRIFNELMTKGQIYHAYRFFQKQADFFASDHHDDHHHEDRHHQEDHRHEHRDHHQGEYVARLQLVDLPIAARAT